jgi:hypothetical protein
LVVELRTPEMINSFVDGISEIVGDRTRTPLPAKVVLKLVCSLFGVIGLAGAAGFVMSLFTDGYFWPSGSGASISV